MQTANKGGRPKGSLNKSTRHARETLTNFLEDSLPKLNEWLAMVAHGVVKVNAQGQPLRDLDGSLVYLNRPDPEAAIKAVSDLLDFHLPRNKSQDVNVTGVVAHVDGSEWTQEDLTKLSLSDLKRLALQHMSRGDIIDVTPTEVVPDWLEPG